MSNTMDGTDDGRLWKGSEADEDVGSECVKIMMALIVKMETAAVIGKGR